MRNAIRSVRSWGARRLTMEQKLWLSKFGHREHEWQKRILKPRQVPGVRAQQGFDALRNVQQNLQTVRSALTGQGIEFVQLPQISRFQPILVVSERQVTAVIETAVKLPRSEGWQMTIVGRNSRTMAIAAAKAMPKEIRRIYLERRITDAGGITLSTPQEQVVIEPWKVLGKGTERVDGETHIPGTLHRKILKRTTAIEYITPDNWRHAVDENDSAIEWSHPHVLDVQGPVDIVYTWVDGSDPEWSRRKQRAAGTVVEDEFNETAANFSRYASRDELLYSLRSVEYYANWVNHIYIVTDKQIPEWLNTEHPKITVVDHTEVFSDPSVLPVFNSHAIESQLHHIPGLSEKYLYLNDDFFFMRPVEPTLFYTGNGLSRFFPSTAPLDVDPASARDLPVLSAAKRNRTYMIENYGRVVTNKFKHTPQPQLKSVLDAMEAEHPELFRQVAASQFRHPDDYSIPSALYHFDAYARGKAIDSRIKYAYMDIARPDAELYLQRLSRRTDLDVLCLNDTNTSESDQNRLDQLLRGFLDERFPVPSSFERNA